MSSFFEVNRYHEFSISLQKNISISLRDLNTGIVASLRTFTETSLRDLLKCIVLKEVLLFNCYYYMFLFNT